MSDPQKKDVIIFGGGMVGLVLAAALSKANFTIAVIESKEPCLDWDETDYDARVSAINLASMCFLNDLHVWSNLQSTRISPVDRMLVWDTQGGGEIDFNAYDVHEEALAYIVENREIIRVLWEKLTDDPNVDLIFPCKADSVTVNDHEVRLRLDNDVMFISDVIVGADGAQSWLRSQMPIEIVEKPYQHHAVVAVIHTEKPHERTAYQPFLKTGPLGVLPLNDSHRIAIVWSTNPAHANELMAMKNENFNRALTNAIGSRLGHMQCLSNRQSIPLTMRHAKQYIAERMALVGDAAHTIHPLAGQGVNLGFMDAACFSETLSNAKEKSQAIGSTRVLRRYERWRRGDNALMLLAMRLFKEGFADQSPLWVSLRSFGLNMTNKQAWIKKYFMQAANFKS